MAQFVVKSRCRVCSGYGQHKIDLPIPFYLHENEMEAVLWHTPIRKLLEGILMISVPPDDGLPQNICTLCISYMKHAIQFQRQALSCREKLLSRKMYAQGEAPDDAMKLDKNDIHMMSSKVKVQDNKKFLPPATRDVLPKIALDTGGFFSYHQKPFVEDDVTEMFNGQNIVANPPEKLSQRKCAFCQKIFMFEETFDKHTTICIYEKFASFIYQCNQVYHMKLHGRITPHEFIRRMVFMLQSHQKILDKLQACEKDITHRQIVVSNESPQSFTSQSSADVPSDTVSEETSPEPPYFVRNDVKKVKCSACGTSFMTISHLDIHRLICSK